VQPLTLVKMEASLTADPTAPAMARLVRRQKEEVAKAKRLQKRGGNGRDLFDGLDFDLGDVKIVHFQMDGKDGFKKNGRIVSNEDMKKMNQKGAGIPDVEHADDNHGDDGDDVNDADLRGDEDKDSLPYNELGGVDAFKMDAQQMAALQEQVKALFGDQVEADVEFKILSMDEVMGDDDIAAAFGAADGGGDVGAAGGGQINSGAFAAALKALKEEAGEDLFDPDDYGEDEDGCGANLNHK
jgi:hypothetical protein